MIDEIRKSVLLLVGVVCVFSGLATILLGKWLEVPVAARADLREITGLVTDAVDIKHYKEYNTSYELWIRNGDARPVSLDIVKQDVAPKTLQALVGKPVTALYSGTLIYQLTADGRTLVTYDNVARTMAFSNANFLYSGGTCIVAGIGLLALGLYRRRRRSPDYSAASRPN